MAEQAAQQQQQQQPVTSSAEGQQGSGTPSSQQGGGSDQSGTAAQGSGSAERQPVSKVAALLQLVQLSLVLAALLLWPAATQPAGIVCLRVWLLYAIYWVFFALGTVHRQLKYGKLASRKSDKQRSSLPDRLALISFIVSVVLLHWLPVLRYTKLGIYPTHITLYEMLGFPAVAAALFINNRAAKDLGEAWDRVVAPKRLVTTGVYTHLQHPIYTSYMLLFFGSAMLLHSAPYALLFIAICCAYYMRRTALESKVLEQAFGDEYREWAAKTPRFLPFF